MLYGCGDFLSDYEGIHGYEAFRGDLAVMYLPTVERATGRLRSLRIVPFRLRRMRLERATAEETVWLAGTFRRAGAAFGTEVRIAGDGTLATP